MSETKVTISLHVPVPDEWEYRQRLYLDYASTIHNAPYGDNGIDGIWDISEEWLRGFFASLQKNSPHNGKDWYAYIIANGEPVGEVSLMPRNDNLVSILIHAEHRGKGYAEPALCLLCEKAFDEFELPYVIDEFPPERIAAERVFTKLGFVREDNNLLRLTRERFMEPAELVFVRKGLQYNDPDVRIITEEDDLLIKELCEDSCENDTQNGKNFANRHYSRYDYISDDNDFKILLGVFHEGKLVGLVEVVRYENTDFIDICSLFVHKSYRRRGFGSRLVKAGLGLYPEKDYQYRTCKRYGDDSTALALSLGFKFVTEITNNDDIFQKIKDVMEVQK